MAKLSTCIVVVLAVFSVTAWSATPCTTATSPCTEWIGVGSGAGRAVVYRTHALDVRNEAVTRALVVVHGQGRDADGYFRTAVAAGFLAGALENTAIVSPRFSSSDGSCRDTLAPQEVNWICAGPESWRSGGPAAGNAAITSFDFADAIVQRLARKESFPNLKTIVVAGHSAGGQFVARYAMSNPLHDRLGVPMTYVVANPSSYTYLDNQRPTLGALPANVAALPPGYTKPPAVKPPAPFAAFPDAASCTAFDAWPYGLQKRSGHSARFPDEQLRKQVLARPTTFLVGELDILPLYGFDGSCPAMAQGPTRLARGLAYVKHLNDIHGAQHKALVIPACGHSARCMFTADSALPLLFPQ